MGAPCLAGHKQSSCPVEGGTWAPTEPWTSLDLALGLELVLGVNLSCIQGGFISFSRRDCKHRMAPWAQDLSCTHFLVSLHHTPAITQSAARQLPRLLQSFGLISWKRPMENSGNSEAQPEPGGLVLNKPHQWHWRSRMKMQKQDRDLHFWWLLLSCTAVKARFCCLLSISLCHFTWLGMAGFLKSRAKWRHGGSSHPEGACNLLICENSRFFRGRIGIGVSIGSTAMFTVYVDNLMCG